MKVKTFWRNMIQWEVPGIYSKWSYFIFLSLFTYDNTKSCLNKRTTIVKIWWGSYATWFTFKFTLRVAKTSIVVCSFYEENEEKITQIKTTSVYTIPFKQKNRFSKQSFIKTFKTEKKDSTKQFFHKTSKLFLSSSTNTF